MRVMSVVQNLQRVAARGISDRQRGQSLVSALQGAGIGAGWWGGCGGCWLAVGVGFFRVGRVVDLWARAECKT